MEYFVKETSIVRKIWGKGDTVLFIFAGAAAEFALNKAVDWLYYTGKLPADPIGRLFSTVTYARRIVFSENDEALKAIDSITAIHKTVENNRGAKIPGWAYRDVLYMLIHYSISAFDLLERKLSDDEKEEVYNVFYRLGSRMHLAGLPASYTAWQPDRLEHMKHNLEYTRYTKDLFLQYKKHLGKFRYAVLKQSQALVVPPIVKNLLGFSKLPLLKPAVSAYKLARFLRMDSIVKAALLPVAYQQQIKELDVVKKLSTK